MRYIDIGNVSESTHSAPKNNHKRSSRATKNHKKNKRNPLKVAAGFIFLGVLVFALYSFLPPIRDAIAGVFNGSVNIVSDIATGIGPDLKQTNGKTNILLIGIDRREDEPYTVVGNDGQTYHTQFRSDTIVIASYNYESEKVTMLSLPRDLYVDVPAFGEIGGQSMKINGVYGTGDVYEYPGGGQALLAKVVSTAIGMPIHYTARIDFSGFEKAIDSVGGIEVKVENAFTDYQYPIEGKETAWPEYKRYKTITFKKGLQHMDGATALEFSRSRHAAGEEGSDFARARRQQLVINAFKDKVLSTDTLLNPGAIGNLLGTLNESFTTTLTPAEYPAALGIAKDAQNNKVASYNLDDRDDHPGGILYAPPMSQYGGAYVLIPENGWSSLRRFAQQIFSAQGYQESSPSASPTKTSR